MQTSFECNEFPLHFLLTSFDHQPLPACITATPLYANETAKGFSKTPFYEILSAFR